MRVYHGSYTAIQRIDLSKSKPQKDFGRGFYVTKFRHHAEAWAKIIGKKIKMNRNKRGETPAHDYDVIEGPVADDKVQFTLRVYLRGEISREKFLQMLSHHEETHQICFCTLNSLQLLDYVENLANSTSKLSHMGGAIVEKLMLENGMDESHATDLFYNSKTFTQLADATTGYHEKSWQEIYGLLKKELRLPSQPPAEECQ